MAGGSFFAELRKRKVFRAAAIYGAVSWGLTEVVVTVVEQLFLPQWVSTLAVIGFVVGFPVAMFLAWTFDITSEGFQRTAVSSRRGKASVAVSILLLIAGTAGLFVLISPSLQQSEQIPGAVEIVPNSIAVLPFENVSRRDDDDYLSEGLGDELRDQLSRMRGLKIAARSSSIAIRNQAIGAVRMAAALGVAYLVEGSLRRNGPRLSISVQLIDGRTGLAVWSENFERGRMEMLEVQQDVARQVIALVLPDAPGIELASPATMNASANDLMLLARHYENKVRARQVRDDETLHEAIRLYRQAVQADPESALAHSRLASALLFSDDIEAAEAPIFKALSLDPGLSEVQNTLGEFYWARGRPEAAIAWERAVELNPNNADALHNYAIITLLTWAGHEHGIASPVELFRRALELDPLSLQRHAAYGEVLGKFGHWDEVPPVIAKIDELFDDAESHHLIGWLYELIGELDQSVAWALKARRLEPDNPDHNSNLANLFAQLGDEQMARQLEPSPSVGLLFQLRSYDELIDAAEFRMIEEPGDVEVRYLLAFAYVATDAFEPAIRILGSTGLPDTLLEDAARSVSEIEAFDTLIGALAGSGLPEANEAAISLAQWQQDMPWWGEIGWRALFRSCNFAILGRHKEALELLPRIKESPRLRRAAYLRDSWCFRQYAEDPVYQDVLQDQEVRRAALRARLPATLAEHGVSL